MTLPHIEIILMLLPSGVVKIAPYNDKRGKTMSKLDDARVRINEIDREMAQLFSERMKAVEDVAAYKKERGLPIFDEKREQAVIEKNAAFVEDPAIRAHYIRFLQEEMAVSKRYQETLLNGEKVAYSGIPGAFANIAAKKIFPGGRITSFPDFKTAYAAVESGDCDCCVLPIENSFAGEVSGVMDLMFSGSLFLNGVYTLKISQHLLGVKGATLSDIKKVISHPQALAQCAEYLEKHSIKTMDATNTALAARSVRDDGDKTIGAIASEETAKLYGLKILDRDINTSAQNSTRFAVLSRVRHTAPLNDGAKFILMFSVRNEAGALAKAINVIGSYGYNMKALLSRPMKELPWQYYFYIEGEGDLLTENGERMLSELKAHCDRLKTVGRYSDEITLKDGEENE